MCFSRRSFRREEPPEETREDLFWDLPERESEAERPRPIADRERAERDAEESRDKVPVGV